MSTAENSDLVSSPLLPCATVVALLVVIRILRLHDRPERPVVTLNDGERNRMRYVLDLCPMLKQRYIPTMIWGRNGHFQTIAYGAFGRAKKFSVPFERHCVQLKCGGTSTFDVFWADNRHKFGDFTIAICPGIANSSESAYVRTFVKSAGAAGFRCAVLNHLGALRSVPLTSNRIFTYGGTEEYSLMLTRLLHLFPETKLIVVGFSMGANLVTKFLGEGGHDYSQIVAGVSVCQGYDCQKASFFLHQWEGLRRLYLYVMTENIKKLLRHHYDTVVTPHVQSGAVIERLLWASTSLTVLDDVYTVKVCGDQYGFRTVDSYYSWCSCSRVMKHIKIPMLYLNAADDPLVVPELYQLAENAARTQLDTLFVLTKHGGHLGFLEGSVMWPKDETWLDRFLVEYATAAIEIYVMDETKTDDTQSDHSSP